MKISKRYIQNAYPNKILRCYAYRGNVDNPKLNELPLYADEIIAYGAVLNFFKDKEDYTLLEKIAKLSVYEGLEELQKPEISIPVYKDTKTYSNIFHFLNSVKKKSRNNNYLNEKDIELDKKLNSGLKNRNLSERLRNADPSVIRDYKNILFTLSTGWERSKNEYATNYDKGLVDILSKSNIPLNSNKEKKSPINLTLF